MRNLLFFVATLGALSGLGLGQAPTLREGHLGFEWPTAETLHQANRLDKQLVSRLVQSLQEDQLMQVGIGEFRFAVLEPGKVHLIATTDYSGRSFFYSLSIAAPTPEGLFSYQSVDSDGPHVLGREIVDLDGDGICELLTKELAIGYEGVETVPLYWISINKLSDGKLIDQSARFKDFYRNEYMLSLRLWQRATAESPNAAEASKDSTLFRKAGAVAEFLRFRMERRVFGQPAAGLQRALQWSRTSKANLQILAARTLGEIDDSRAEKALERLTQSPNPLVANSAEAALLAKRER